MKERKTVKENFATGDPEPPVRGRPRSLQARAAVLRAARALLDAGGLGAVTIEALSTKTGVSKPTIYRTWPNAHAVAMSALMDGPGAPEDAETPAARTGRGLAALKTQLCSIVDVFASRTGRSVTHVLAAADPGTELSKVFRNRFILARRDEGRGLLREAIARGDVRPGVDIEIALDLIYAPIFYRILVGHAPLDEAFVDGCLDLALRGLRAPRKAAR